MAEALIAMVIELIAHILIVVCVITAAVSLIIIARNSGRMTRLMGREDMARPSGERWLRQSE
ncbi:MAG: hypothetical protein LBV00_04705 [Propionibacteriaceae bacterium]|jgi:hypothetical protein|nr:hypothetical protein [Propionibacteriaceae bacterium]